MAILFSLDIRHPGDGKKVAWGSGAAGTRVHQTTPDPTAEDGPRLWGSYHPVVEAAEAPSPTLPTTDRQ